MKRFLSYIFVASCIFSLQAQDPSNMFTIELVKSIYPNHGSIPRDFVIFNDELYFRADHEIYGTELWKTDGTEEGTSILKDINPAGDGVERYFEIDYAELNGELFFSANDGIHHLQLWKTDGTEEGTKMVKQIHTTMMSRPNGFITFHDRVIFAATELIHGTELWATDGTEEGTTMVKDINTNNFASSYPNNFKIFQDRVFFTANNGINGKQPWYTDGTEAGTKVLKNINPTSTSMSGGFTEFNGKLYFAAKDGGVHGTELWVSDGTEEGTYMVKDINPTPYQPSTPAEYDFVEFQNKLFFAATDGVHGTELWTTDGTEEGTVMVKDINPNGSSNPYYLTTHNNKLFFVANNETYGSELWVSDGTEEGTVILKDIRAGIQSSIPRHLTPLNELLFFSAENEEGIRHLWVTDGTEEGTQMLKPEFDESTNDAIPYAGKFITMGDALFFPAKYTSEVGEELYKLTIQNTVSLPNIQKENIKIYPNPTRGDIYISGLTEEQEFILYDAFGRQLKNMKLNREENTFSINNLASGIYFLMNLNTYETLRIIKE